MDTFVISFHHNFFDEYYSNYFDHITSRELDKEFTEDIKNLSSFLINERFINTS